MKIVLLIPTSFLFNPLFDLPVIIAGINDYSGQLIYGFCYGVSGGNLKCTGIHVSYQPVIH
ncbi:MAG TPA: hypothetical protein VHP36_09875 [Chitinispirillaceae bacterium]|nr:hypothetical protein [Chitinispirillaceae bacterium]